MVAGRRTGPGRWRRAVSQSRIQAMQRGQLLSLAPHAGVQLATHALRLERAHQGSVAAWALRAAWPSGQRGPQGLPAASGATGGSVSLSPSAPWVSACCTAPNALCGWKEGRLVREAPRL